MSRTRIVTLVCWLVSAVALLGLVVWLLLSGIFSFGFNLGIFEFGNFQVVGTHSVPAADIDSLDVDWTSGGVFIGTHSGDDIRITEFARRNLRAGEELSLGTEGSTLVIEFTENHRAVSIGFNNPQTKRLEVLIPYTLSENFDRFYVNTVSGRVEVRNMQAHDFSVSTTSGRIELFGITATNLRASTTSGRIELNTAEAEDIHLHTVSGSIETNNALAESLRTNTTSGRHELSGSFGYVNARSTSGRIEIRSTIIPASLTARTSSGRIAVTVPNEGAITVQYSTGSGRFTSEMPVTTHGGADAQFNLSTGSGRISIYELR